MARPAPDSRRFPESAKSDFAFAVLGFLVFPRGFRSRGGYSAAASNFKVAGLGSGGWPRRYWGLGWPHGLTAESRAGWRGLAGAQRGAGGRLPARQAAGCLSGLLIPRPNDLKTAR